MASTSKIPSTEMPTNTEAKPQPVVMVVIGMAGSGKTTFIKKIVSHLSSIDNVPYVINLDPACTTIPYKYNIDIRDNVKYKQVMENYKQGPNGAIITCLNMFAASNFPAVLEILEKRSADHEFIIIDTPGQIEVFNWSSSGSIILESLASSFPTVVVYIMDTVRSVNATTFMSNMMYACSLLYKSKLPLLVTMNKTDIVDNKFAIDWMADFELFEQELSKGEGYMNNLVSSMSLVLDEFYKDLHCVGVSSLTGKGLKSFFVALKNCVDEYNINFKPEYERLKLKEKTDADEKKKLNLERFVKDNEIDKLPEDGPEASDLCIDPFNDERSSNETDSEED